jgi:hypothetical protein
VIHRRFLWAGMMIAAWQFLGCSQISEQTDITAGSMGSVANQTINRKVYKLSVIPGGVYSGAELARARRTDPVVEAHYADFGGDARVTQLKQDELVYVSYRRQNKVYWTKTKHRVCKGEAVLTDGKNMARSRCGNRLSETAKSPTMKGEPTGAVLTGAQPPETFPSTGGPVDTNTLAGPGFAPGAGPGVVTGAGNGGNPVQTAAVPPVTTGAGSEFPEPATFYPAASPYFGGGPVTARRPLVSTGGGTTPTGTTTPTEPVTSVTALPEPASLGLAAMGGLVFFALRSRRRKHRS